jgi:polysaccharide biosynthesis protein PslH
MSAAMLAETTNSLETQAKPGRWLFVKERFAWPRASGHDVHTFYMMKGLTQLGHTVSVLTLTDPPKEALAGLPLHKQYSLDRFELSTSEFPNQLSKSQAKFASYWGTSETAIRQVGAAAADCKADAVVVSGLNVLPYLGAVKNAKKIWYAADEWVWHHLSLVKTLKPKTWSEIKPAIIKGLYERAYRSLLDRVWVVSQADARAFRWLIGLNQLDIIPNGVDAEHYTPGTEPQTPNSCVFWGRLDFGPNIQALEWFCQKVWPQVRQRVPDAQFQVFGFQPTPEVESLTKQPGITLTANLPDIRPAVRGGQVVVLPFISGGGIKNKLLEAAAMGLPIVCSSRAFHGLTGKPPLQVADQPRQWVDALVGLWQDGSRRTQAGAEARAWVQTHHTWTAAAQLACDGIGLSVSKRGPS